MHDIPACLKDIEAALLEDEQQLLDEAILRHGTTREAIATNSRLLDEARQEAFEANNNSELLRFERKLRNTYRAIGILNQRAASATLPPSGTALQASLEQSYDVLMRYWKLLVRKANDDTRRAYTSRGWQLSKGVALARSGAEVPISEVHPDPEDGGAILPTPRVPINARMVATLQKNPEAVEWTVEEWCQHLGCNSKASVAGTHCWEQIMAARAMRAADRMQAGRKRTPRGRKRTK